MAPPHLGPGRSVGRLQLDHPREGPRGGAAREDGEDLRDRPGLREGHADVRRADVRAPEPRQSHLLVPDREPHRGQRRVPVRRDRPGRHPVRRARAHRDEGEDGGRLDPGRLLQRLHRGRDVQPLRAAGPRGREREAHPHAGHPDRPRGVQEPPEPPRSLRGEPRGRARGPRPPGRRGERHPTGGRAPLPLRLGPVLDRPGNVQRRSSGDRARGRPLGGRAQGLDGGRRPVADRGGAQPRSRPGLSRSTRS